MINIKHYRMSFLEEMRNLRITKYSEQEETCIAAIKDLIRENTLNDNSTGQIETNMLYGNILKHDMKSNIVKYFTDEGFGVKDHYSSGTQRFPDGITISFK